MPQDKIAESQDDRIQCQVCKKWFRFLHANHLKTHLMTADEYKRKYNVAFLMPKKVRELLASRIGGAQRYRAWEKHEIVAELKKHAQSCKPLTCTYVNTKDPSLVAQAIRAFGAWKDALKAAGIQGTRHREWSEDKIIRSLEQRQREGKALNLTAIMEEDRHLLVAIQRYFGGLDQALERIGVDYRDVMRVQPWDEVAYGKDLLAWCAKHGPLSPKQVSETAPRLYRFARNRYGSLKQAARHHNLPFKGQRTRWTRERVAEELRNYHRRYGPIQEHKLSAFSLPLYMATRRYFGSLRNAASELLLPFVSAFKTWDEQIIIDELRSRAEEKRPLQAPIVQKEGGGLFKAAIRYFGSWKKAKEAAGV